MEQLCFWCISVAHDWCLKHAKAVEHNEKKLVYNKKSDMKYE